MKNLVFSAVLGLSLLCSASSDIRIEAETLAGNFKISSVKHLSGGKNAGKWHELSGSVNIPEAGTWSAWIRCSASWKYFVRPLGLAKAQNMRHFAMEINGKKLKFGTELDIPLAWIEQKTVLPRGTHHFTLKKLGIDPYVDVIVFTRNPEYKPAPDWHMAGNKKSQDAIIRHVTASGSSEKKIFGIPKINPPQLDGALGDPAWEKAFTGELEIVGSKQPPRERTRYWIGCDSKNLYVAFCCSESRPADLKRTFTHPEDRDNNIFFDDSVEILVVLSDDGSSKFQFIINADGVIYDSHEGNRNFQSNIKLSSKITPPGWMVEAAIPFADLGISPKGAEALMINLARARQNEPRENSCLKAGDPKTGFHHLSHFMLFQPQVSNRKAVPVVFFSFGSENNPVICFRNADSRDQEKYAVVVRTFDNAGKQIGTFSGTSVSGKNGSINWKSGKKRAAGIRYSVYRTSDRKEIYSNTLRFLHLPRLKATRTIKDPLFESLLSKEYPRQIGYSAFTWSFCNLAFGNQYPFFYQYGIAYDFRNYVRKLCEIEVLSMFTPGVYAWWHKHYPDEKKNIPVLMYPLVRSLPGLDGRLLIVPEIRARYLQIIREMTAKPEVRSIFVGDEIEISHENLLISAMHKEKKVHPAILAIDKRIKKEFGQGKYGIPKKDEKNPFALIAFRRFLDHELNDLFREAAAEARKVNPDIIIVSPDALGSMSLIYDFTQWKGLFDVVTHQLDPQNENIDAFGFLTRYLADLSGAELVWPCPHVEQYSKTFTPSEVLDELSSAIRNGANGFHYFLNDTRGRFSKNKYLVSEYWGAPDRFETLINVSKYLKTMPKLKKFERDAAVFVATDTLRAYVKSKMEERDTYLHGFLGNGAGVNYSIINENKLDDLAKFKIIFTSQCKYIPAQALKKLQDYVNRGGRLVVLDPEAFSFTPEGKDLSAERAKFLGIAGIAGWGKTDNIKFAGQILSFRNANYAKVKLAAGASAAAGFANKDAAVVRQKYGKGEVLTFTSIPCRANLAGNRSWEKMFEYICASAGCRTNSPIWRFRLPEKFAAQLKNPPGLCLTDNFILWRSFQPDLSCNAEIGGSYMLSPAPDSPAESVNGWIPFSKGKLTDRPRAALAPSALLGASRWSQWVIGYKPSPKAVTIDFKFNKKQTVRKAKLWVAGDRRSYEFSAGGKKFTVTGKFSPSSLMELVEIELPEKVISDKAQIKISGGSRKLIISEVEIWSE